MTVTSSTRPFRSATPVKVAPACVVLPFFTPAMPGYGAMPKSPVSSRLVFWISKVSRFLPGFASPGKAVRTVAAYSRKSGFCMPLRAISVRSYAEETCPGAS
ncbi:hypothetical protein GCM10017667_16240 [Streptomyces filamentosus]|uniref:Uncharacterized protein n=1 Tax=Streptomyces filamentosus TaxID=67294 RepID=A0A919BG90_STRFL|nr:hypothetical protein GCM10017667_16240 [Streptomyces filamentosus]